MTDAVTDVVMTDVVAGGGARYADPMLAKPTSCLARFLGTLTRCSPPDCTLVPHWSHVRYVVLGMSKVHGWDGRHRSSS